MSEKVIFECISKVMQNDMESIIKSFPLIGELKDKKIFITGSTGLLGSQLVYLFSVMNRLRDTNIKIIAMARNKEKAELKFKHLAERGDIEIFLGDICDSVNYEDDIDYIIHCASATNSKYFVTNPVETIETALNGTRNILQLAKQKRIEGMVYLSSLEVHGKPVNQETMVKENDYGYIDILDVRSSYSESKKMVECLCASYVKEYGVPIKIARLSQTFGPGIEYDDGRVFAEFMRCAIEKKDIVLHTQGRTVRSYCYTRDAIEAILYILLKGKKGEAYNVTNMDTSISIYDMAKMVAETISDRRIKIIVEDETDISNYGYNPEMIIRIDSNKLSELGWKATVDLEESYRRMVGYFER